MDYEDEVGSGNYTIDPPSQYYCGDNRKNKAKLRTEAELTTALEAYKGHILKEPDEIERDSVTAADYSYRPNGLHNFKQRQDI